MKITWHPRNGLGITRGMDNKLLHLDWPPRLIWGRWLPNLEKPIVRVWQVGPFVYRHCPLPQVLAVRQILSKQADRAKLDKLPGSRKFRRRMRNRRPA